MKIFYILCLIISVAADHYEYSNPMQKLTATSARDASDDNSHAATDNSHAGTDENNIYVDNSQEIPRGYDYQPHRSNYQPSGSNYQPHGSNYQPHGSDGVSLHLQTIRETPANYEYSYGVHDESSGDIKSHSESRIGDLVRGVYSLIDPDGYRRTVTYTVDGATGFNAVVDRTPIAVGTENRPDIFVKSMPALQQILSPKEQRKISAHEPYDSYSVISATDADGPYS